MVFSNNSERKFSPIELALFEALLEAQSAAVHGSEFLEDCRNGQEPDEEESSFVKAARKGDVQKLRQLLSQRKKGARPAILNQARCWTELETFLSVVVGFPEYNKWFDLTALATAAKEMHPDAVYFLLREGADPTLKGCPSEDEILDPLGAAKDGYERALRMIHLGDVFSLHVKDAEVLADMAFEMLEDARKCRSMIAACLPFWKPASYADAEFCESRAESGFPNRPTDSAAMLKALEEARYSTMGSDEQKELDELKEKLLEKLERVHGKEKRNVRVLSGTVKWFNANKGYGRIAQEGGDNENEEFFIHKSNIEGSRVLKPREKVQFQTRPSCNGKLDLAVNVTIISDNRNGCLD